MHIMKIIGLAIVLLECNTIVGISLMRAFVAKVKSHKKPVIAAAVASMCACCWRYHYQRYSFESESDRRQNAITGEPVVFKQAERYRMPESDMICAPSGVGKTFLREKTASDVTCDVHPAGSATFEQKNKNTDQ